MNAHHPQDEWLIPRRGIPHCGMFHVKHSVRDMIVRLGQYAR